MSDEYFEEEEFTTQFNGKTAVRIVALTRPYWRWLVGFLFAIGFVSLLDSFFTYLNKLIIDQAITTGDTSALFRIASIYGVLILVQAVGVFGFIFLAGVLGERIRYDLRQKMFDHLQDLSLAYYNHTPVGWIMSRVTSDSERVADLVTWGLLDVTWAADEHPDLRLLYAADQSSPGAHRLTDGSCAGCRCRTISPAHSDRIPRLS